MSMRATKIDPDNLMCLKCRRTASKKKYSQSERGKELRKEWLSQNREKVLATKRKYAKTDKGKISLSKNIQKRRALKFNNGSYEISKNELIKIYNSPCFECSKNSDIHLDHIIPLSRGGQHSIGNIISLCGSCNRSKGNKTITEWRLWKDKNI